MTEETTSEQPVPARVRQTRRISPFWLLPIIAFVIGAFLFFQILQEQGEKISIRFNDGGGIVAGKTVIRYQGLQIGSVKKVAFAEGLKEVEVIAEINPEAKSVLRKNTKFWLVKPSASLAGISGLDALVSGNYITLLPGDGDSENQFIAENEAPVVPLNEGDMLIRLYADNLGSISVGSSVFYRKVPVGSVLDYRFSTDQKSIELDIVINKKYTNLVKKDSRFWNISGINANIGLSGISVTMDSLSSIIQGAIAFDSPDNSSLAAQGHAFELFDNLKAAKRGIKIEVTLPDIADLKENDTAVYYQGTQIGILSTFDVAKNHEILQDRTITDKGISGVLLIDPSMVDLFRESTKIILKDRAISLENIELSQLNKLLRGRYLEVIAGKGELSRAFKVELESEYLLNLPDTLALTLTAPQSYGVNVGQGIYYDDIKIGEILRRHLTADGVVFQSVIYPNYQDLISADTQFISASNLDISVGIDGMRVQAASPQGWLKGGVRILLGKKRGKAAKQYPLFRDMENAEAGLVSGEKKTTVTLSAPEVSGIDRGSVVLYRQFPIGEVLNIRPQAKKFEIDLFIKPTYQHLLTEKSRFWIEPAVQLDLSSKGLNLKASPLLRSLKGAISFDNQGIKQDRTLYPSQGQATAGDSNRIMLVAKDAAKLAKGMPIKYLGLTVGEVETLQLVPNKNQINVTAIIDKPYFPLVAKKGTKFTAISPEIASSGVKNLDALLQTYIEVQLGQGEKKTQFVLSDTETVASKYSNGFPVIVETSDANGIIPDAPVLYRGMEVGIVQKLTLSELGDRVVIHLNINRKYQHLVRKNSQFWQDSGYTMEVGLNGATINSGTMSQLLRGGIAFSTPSGSIVEPQVSANHRFLLQRKMPEGAKSWDQGTAK